ncbi:MAG: MBL fold metallo-hydrolase, partial [Ruminococcaceae bacterium]|nr:MBL fold metallo-hydrolase [Oscillospiraceae bacterium]
KMLHGTSGHADRQGLLNWYGAFKKKPSTVFVNHGDDEACEAFKELLIKEYGCRAIAPYSGAEFDLLSEEFINEAEGVRIKKNKETNSGAGHNSAVSSAEALLKLLQANKGLSNSLLRGIKEDIEKIINKIK